MNSTGEWQPIGASPLEETSADMSFADATTADAISTDMTWVEAIPTDTAPTTFQPTNLSIYAQYSRGLWQPTDPAIFLIMKSTFVHSTPTLSHESIDPIAHCLTLEAAHQALDTLAQQRPYGDLLKDSKWGWFQIAGERVTHTFWVKEVGHARALKWMDFGDKEEDEDGWDVDEDTVYVSDDTAYASDDTAYTFDGIASDDTVSQGTSTTTDQSGMETAVDICDNDSVADAGLSHVFFWMKNPKAVAEQRPEFWPA